MKLRRLAFVLILAFSPGGLPARAQGVDDTSETTAEAVAEDSEEEETTPAPPVQRVLPDTAWNRISADAAYSYRDSVEYVRRDPTTSREPNAFYRALLAFLAFLGSAAGQALLWILFGVLVIAVLLRVVTSGGKFSFAKKVKVGREEVTLLPEDAPDGDWELLSRQAAAAGDFRLAMRFGYRLALKRLDAGGLIEYRPDKPDQAYRDEVRGTAVADPFAALLRRYQRVWYGGYAAAQADFEGFQNGLASVLEELPAS